MEKAWDCCRPPRPESQGPQFCSEAGSRLPGLLHSAHTYCLLLREERGLKGENQRKSGSQKAILARAQSPNFLRAGGRDSALCMQEKRAFWIPRKGEAAGCGPGQSVSWFLHVSKEEEETVRGQHWAPAPATHSQEPLSQDFRSHPAALPTERSGQPPVCSNDNLNTLDRWFYKM